MTPAYSEPEPSLTPQLPLTVTFRLWEAIAETTSVAFADSYLSGAFQAANVLTTKTGVACDRLWANADVRRVLKGQGIKLRNPLTTQIMSDAPTVLYKGKIEFPRLGGRDYRRRPGENETMYARRLWPNRERKPLAEPS